MQMALFPDFPEITWVSVAEFPLWVSEGDAVGGAARRCRRPNIFILIHPLWCVALLLKSVETFRYSYDLRNFACH